MTGKLYFRFCPDGFENHAGPCITCDNPTGGDPVIICTIQRVHRRELLWQLSHDANDHEFRRTILADAHKKDTP